MVKRLLRMTANGDSNSGAATLSRLDMIEHLSKREDDLIVEIDRQIENLQRFRARLAKKLSSSGKLSMDLPSGRSSDPVDPE